MKHFKLLFFLYLFSNFLISFAEFPPCAVTNIEAAWCDRLGDRLVWYLKSKWIAYKYKLPFLLTPFEGAEYFKLSEQEQKLCVAERKQYKKVVRCLDERKFSFSPIPGVLYGIDFGCEISDPVTENDLEEFRKEVHPLLMPTQAMPILEKREGVITVAVQMRKGSGPDKGLRSIQYYNQEKPRIYFESQPLIVQEPCKTNDAVHQKFSGYSDGGWPFRFVPDQYYIDQLKLLTNVFKGRSLDVFIFTDHANPAQLTKQVQQAVNDPHLTFHYQHEHAVTGYAVVRDIFLMAQCDCLIRPRSHISHIAEFIGDHQIVIFPCNYIWQGNKLIVTEVSIKVKDAALKALIESIL